MTTERSSYRRMRPNCDLGKSQPEGQDGGLRGHMIPARWGRWRTARCVWWTLRGAMKRSPVRGSGGRSARKKSSASIRQSGSSLRLDGTIGTLERSSYEAAEEKVIRQSTEMRKPFVIILNSTEPSSDNARLSLRNGGKIRMPVMRMNCARAGEC